MIARAWRWEEEPITKEHTRERHVIFVVFFAKLQSNYEKIQNKSELLNILLKYLESTISFLFL